MTGRFWVSSTEPKALRSDLADVVPSRFDGFTVHSNTFPETFGVDAMWSAPPPTAPNLPRAGLIGVQRKTVPDLVASLADGRLQREFALFSSLYRVILLIEGPERWAPDGSWADNHRLNWSLTRHRALLRTVQASGVWVITSPSLAHTADVICEEMAFDTRHHHSLVRRPDQPTRTNGWGESADPSTVARNFAIHLLQSFPGIGPTTAAAIVDKFDGLPMAWTVTKKDLCEVDGVGPKTAERLLSSLPTPDAQAA